MSKPTPTPPLSPGVLAALDGHWPTLYLRINDYAMGVHDAASHQSASKADIANSQALSALQSVRRAIEDAVSACVAQTAKEMH